MSLSWRVLDRRIELQKLKGFIQKYRAYLRFALVSIVLYFYYQSLPPVLFDSPYSSALYSEKGELLSVRIAADDQWRLPPKRLVANKFKTALIAFEDKRFAYHPGVDPIALSRALASNLSSGKRLSGASTLTMQTIRLMRNNPPRTYWEKFKEMILATRLELRLNKQQIISLYAAHAPFGGNIVGIEAASWRYFGRAPQQLSWAESAMLAVLPNNPAMIHLQKNRPRLKAKRDRLLNKLARLGYLSDLDLSLAKVEPLPRYKKKLPRFAPHLLDSLSRKHKNRDLHTHLNAALQKQLSMQVFDYSEQLKQIGIQHAAALVIDNQSMQVKAYVGNAQYNNQFQSGYSIDLIHRPRSSGSVLKPLLYGVMLQQGEIIPSRLVADLPTQYSGYAPQNYDREFRGAVPVSQALAQSLNIPAVRLVKQFGVDRFYDFLKNLGLTSLHRTPQAYGLPIILGGAEITLWDIAASYANLASIAQDTNQTHYIRVKLLKNKPQARGKTIEIGSGAAWLTLQALLDVQRPGSDRFWKNFKSSQKVAWKTGTSYGLKDGWAIGVTPRWTVAVWVGNADGHGVPNLTGVTAAAPLMFAIFNRLTKSHWFATPYQDLKQVTVCKDDGYMSNGQCDEKTQLIPRHSHFAQLTPYHIQIHLDKKTGLRVNSHCEKVRNMKSVNQFVLPPAMEFYYQRAHSQYQAMPEFRADCLTDSGSNASPMAFIYPQKGTKVYIPIDLDGQPSQVIFEAVHRRADATIYWHLDDQYLTATKQFHQLATDLEPGWHRLTLVDEKGFQLSQRFKVLNR